MIRTYFWMPGARQVGHASAQIGCADEAHATYISWWPETGADLKRPVVGTTVTPDDDIAMENKQPDHIVEIDGLDEVAASNWWEKFKADPNSFYHLAVQNCSGVVVNALKEAGADSFFPWYQFKEKSNYANPDPLPYIRRYGLHAIRLWRNGRLNDLQYLLAEVGDGITNVWTPRDAHSYCTILKMNVARKRAGDTLWIPPLNLKL